MHKNDNWRKIYFIQDLILMKLGKFTENKHNILQAEQSKIKPVMFHIENG